MDLLGGVYFATALCSVVRRIKIIEFDEKMSVIVICVMNDGKEKAALFTMIYDAYGTSNLLSFRHFC